MKIIDFVILIAAISFVGWILYIKVKQHYENKKNGVLGCGGSCMGCDHIDGCKGIQQYMQEITKAHKKV
ncbi:hypothetical protein M2475_001380 [Breznakia sp. PF5-3]|uniref:FeoB-associated Cys-rich membrane protein n=1 Tax=unclassified Breznakia TaxID=2623764 RepID=UPI002405E973|nr:MULTISPECIES: FeoB-associated Cys-rich membrane protein [unclassified Breznakia]MDF9824926.1 hypothetical protein [Breznakia sp. PM6-1]MDF9835806.1 hypothetical protein [Breznakia sp. PF5-3]MDF9837900.1 hypothetical protein [Breznakia sp. PFB2-8]MDF9859889.1 hypothetical protein [Breznakia sp. PH5-24]